MNKEIDYILYVRPDFDYVWGIFSTEYKKLIYIKKIKKKISKYILNHLFNDNRIPKFFIGEPIDNKYENLVKLIKDFESFELKVSNVVYIIYNQ